MNIFSCIYIAEIDDMPLIYVWTKWQLYTLRTDSDTGIYVFIVFVCHLFCCYVRFIVFLCLFVCFCDNLYFQVHFVLLNMSELFSDSEHLVWIEFDCGLRMWFLLFTTKNSIFCIHITRFWFCMLCTFALLQCKRVTSRCRE